jgi:hypothetical protein
VRAGDARELARDGVLPHGGEAVDEDEGAGHRDGGAELVRSDFWTVARVGSVSVFLRLVPASEVRWAGEKRSAKGGRWERGKDGSSCRYTVRMTTVSGSRPATLSPTRRHRRWPPPLVTRGAIDGVSYKLSQQLRQKPRT